MRATLLGFGDCLEDLKARSDATSASMAIVTFTGRVDRPMIAELPQRGSTSVCART